MNGRLAVLRLMPEEAAAVPLLGSFENGHPGVRILAPHYPGEPWRADICEETVPGDDRGMILTSRLPRELLGKLRALFPRPG